MTRELKYLEPSPVYRKLGGVKSHTCADNAEYASFVYRHRTGKICILTVNGKAFKLGGKPMMTKEMKRCKDCAYLVEGDNGEWMCDDCEKDIHDIPDDECSAEQDW